MMEKFKIGEVIYDNDTRRKGQIAGRNKKDNTWVVNWEDGEPGSHLESELWTAQEFEYYSGVGKNDV